MKFIELYTEAKQSFTVELDDAGEVVISGKGLSNDDTKDAIMKAIKNADLSMSLENGELYVDTQDIKKVKKAVKGIK